MFIRNCLKRLFESNFFYMFICAWSKLVKRIYICLLWEDNKYFKKRIKQCQKESNKKKKIKLKSHLCILYLYFNGSIEA